MYLTEHHLDCLKALALADVAKLGGGVNQNQPTQKNTLIFHALVVLLAGVEIHGQEDMKQQERANRLQAAYYRQVPAILQWPDLPPYVTEQLFVTKDTGCKVPRTKTPKDAMKLLNKYTAYRREILNLYNPVIQSVLNKHTPLKSGTQIKELYEALVVAITNNLAADTNDAGSIGTGGSAAKAAGPPWSDGAEATKDDNNGEDEDEDDDEDEDGSGTPTSASSTTGKRGKSKWQPPSSPASNTRSAAATAAGLSSAFWSRSERISVVCAMSDEKHLA